LILSRVGWQAQTGEELYETTFVEEPRPLSPEEEAWAHEVIEDYLEQKRTA
jgi:predicted alpha/beta hydrolase family esterase